MQHRSMLTIETMQTRYDSVAKHDMETISSTFDVDDVNSVNEVWQCTSVYTISTRYI